MNFGPGLRPFRALKTSVIKVIIRNFLLSSKHSALGSRMFRSLPNILRRVGRCESNECVFQKGRKVWNGEK